MYSESTLVKFAERARRQLDSGLREAVIASNKRRKGEKRNPYPASHGVNVSAALTGRTISRVVVEKIRLKNTGKKRTPEFCTRISSKLKGKKKSAEAVANMAVAQLARWKRDRELILAQQAASRAKPS